MKAQINMIGIFTNNLESMVDFYTKVLGFTIKLQLEHYVEFEHDGVRFALSTREVMSQVTKHLSYQEDSKWQSFELAFAVDTSEEVDSTFAEIVEKWAESIQAPANMPWGQRTAFFADPDGNIHEIFTNN